MLLHVAVGYISLAVAQLNKVCLSVTLKSNKCKCRLDMAHYATIAAKCLPRQLLNFYICELDYIKSHSMIVFKVNLFPL